MDVITVRSFRRSEESMPITVSGRAIMPRSTPHGTHSGDVRINSELKMRTAIPTDTITKINRKTMSAMRGVYQPAADRLIRDLRGGQCAEIFPGGAVQSLRA